MRNRTFWFVFFKVFLLLSLHTLEDDWKKWGRDRGGNETVKHVKLWRHLTPIVNLHKKGANFTLSSAAAFLCLNCGYFGQE